MSGRHTTGGYCLLMVAEKMQGTAMGDWAAISAEKLKLPTT
ncbi:hypothetical protein [Corynebacterium pseudotuberculosis]|nr:hypothetical protein [Corynebacterium pseudotuberculosis]WFP67225.1 hypothetical protein P8128_00130 [Corynebacterium pseudotuberculosis]